MDRAMAARHINTPAASTEPGVDEVSRIVSEMRGRGQYLEALTKIKDYLDRHPHEPKLSFELIETYTQQGYINLAYQAIVDWRGSDSVEADKISMLKCFLEPMVTGRFSECAAEADNIMLKYEIIGESDSIWEDVTCIRLYHFKTLALCFIFHHAEYQMKFGLAEQQLLVIVDSYLRRSELEIAFKYTVCLLNEDIKRSKLQYLIQHAPANSLYKAKAQAELAELLTGDLNSSHRKELRSAAGLVLKQFNQHYWQDISIAEALEAVTTSSSDATRIMDKLLADYFCLDYPNGYKKWLYRYLDRAFQLYDYELQHSLEVRIKKLSKETGTLLFSLLSQVDHIARMHQRSGHDNLAKNSLLVLDKDLQPYDLPFSQGQVASILSQLYVNYGDSENALIWADSCRRYWDRCLPGIKSIGHLYHLNAIILGFELSNSADYHNVKELCDKYVAEDLANMLVEESGQKLLALIGMYAKSKKISETSKVAEIEILLSRVETALAGLARRTNTLWASLLQSKANFYMVLAAGREDLEYEAQAAQTLDQALRLAKSEAGGSLTYQFVVIQQMIGLVAHHICTKLGGVARDDQRMFLESAKNSFAACIEGYDFISSPSQVGESTYWVALILYEMRIRGFTSSQDALQGLSAAEDYFDARRTEISVSTGVDAIRSKQALAKEKHARDIYRFAIQICILDNNSSDLWKWVQKAKARSLSDTLGLGCLVPKSLIDAITDDQDTRKVYMEEQRLSSLLRSDPSIDRFAVTIDLRNVQKQMEKLLLLRSLIDLRNGRSLTSQELLDRWAALPQSISIMDVAFVDWYVKSNIEIYVTILRSGHEIVHRRVNCTTADVKAWIEQHIHVQGSAGDFFGRRADHPRQAMRTMDCLVEAIGDYIEPGTLLVLCTSSPLERVPLHALNVRVWSEGKAQTPSSSNIPLITRNPLVYCSNFTVFIQCCENAARRSVTVDDEEEDIQTSSSSFIAVYEGIETEPPDPIERDLVYESTRKISLLQRESDAAAVVITGSDVTLARIRESWQNASRIFFHGHCDLAANDITKQCLIIKATADTESSDESAERQQQQQQSYHEFAVPDVFDLKLKAPLVTLMACASSAQEVGAADEPLGLVTSFLCAGAASVVGAMWPIKSRTARRFAAVFYENLLRAPVQTKEQLSGASSTISERTTIREQGLQVKTSHTVGVINLAVAVQRTIQQLRSESMTSTPYHWAPFVLHGASFLRAGYTG